VDIVDEQLARHTRARGRLVAQLQARVPVHPDVAGLILHGSLGRREADAWSDVDVVVFVDDDAVSDVVQARMAFPDLIGAPVYVLDSPWNAPLDGAQVNALYQLESGLPVFVDWSLFPAKMAAVPTDVQVLYEPHRYALPRLPLPFAQWPAFERQPRPDPAALPRDIVRHAWFGMMPITAKFYARGDRDRLVRLLAGIGAPPPADSADAELSAIRERFDAIASGESGQAVAAVAALIDAAQQFRADRSMW
jgi:predicted nucleotidyltransferase